MLSALAAVPALAQDKPFQGPSVTVIGGVDVGQSFDQAKAGVLYGGQLGYDWQSNNIVFGIEGEVTGATTKKCTSSGGTISACQKADRDLYIGGRIGTVVGESTLLYAKAGYANGRQVFEIRDSATPSNNYSNGGTSDGIRVGAGIEKRIGKNLTAKTEYRYSNYGGDYSRHQGVVGLGFRF
jgi:outer membrane immunogenic protein